MNNNSNWKPFIYALLVALGVAVGMVLRPSGKNTFYQSDGNKFTEAMNLVQRFYVDTVDPVQMEEVGLNKVLSTLDPHSVYISSNDIQSVNERLEGNFEGIGVEFNILDDTILVVTVTPEGPSETAGLKPGDRIVEIEDKNVASTGITNAEVIKQLKGPKGTVASIKVFRYGEDKLLPFSITRGQVPIKSMEAHYMLTNKTGYIKVSRFGQTTHDEFKQAVIDLKKQGMEHLIFDLRNNPGGYLTAATRIVDEFLDGDKLIVYTEGDNQARSTYNCSREGVFETGKLMILINKNSASASEIVSGAVQDWDRGLLLGETSYGKGLVQEPFELKDGSVIRLTVARYYTPSGRCIQKPYRSPFAPHDSTDYDSVRYETSTGRYVYADGGIRPDVEMASDTSFLTPFYYEVATQGILNDFVQRYLDKNRDILSRYADITQYNQKYQVSDATFSSFLHYAQTKGINTSDSTMTPSVSRLKNEIKAQIARTVWLSEGYYTVANADDPLIIRALNSLERYESLLTISH